MLQSSKKLRIKLRDSSLLDGIQYYGWFSFPKNETEQTFSFPYKSTIHITSNHCKSPARSCFSVSQTLQLKSSYPPIISRPLFENATDVMPQIMLSCEYMPISWSERMSNSRQVASSEPVAKANPLGKN